MFELDNHRYVLTKVTTTYKGRLTITREHVINSNATSMDVFQILSAPETYEGERQEAIDELNDMNITTYRHTIIERF